MQPDFDNLKGVWATITPAGVKSSAYAATVKTIAPACPSSSPNGWTIDPSAPLPTLDQQGAGMTFTIPKGSNSTTSTSHSVTYSSTATSASSSGGSTSSTGSAASATTSNSAIRQTFTNPIHMTDLGFISMIVALATLGFGVVTIL